MSKKAVHFKNLDSIRFFAAMMVFLQHGISGSFRHLNIEGSILGKTLFVLSNGGTGVSIFFVLSGFLITYLLLVEIEMTGSLNIKNFYLRRFLRIWPLYFGVVIFSFIVYPGLKMLFWTNSPLPSHVIYHLTFLSNFDLINVIQNHGSAGAMSQDITWSVSIEEQFYLFWPLIFLLPHKSWIYLFLGLIGFSLGFRMLNEKSITINYYHTFSVLVDLVVGGLFAYLVHTKKKIRLLFERTNTRSHLILIIATFLILYFGTGFFLGTFSKSLGRLFTAVLFALIIVSQSLTKNNSILNFSNFKFGNKWGKMTYGIYLLHPIAITLTDVGFRLLNVDYKVSFVKEFGVGILMFVFTLMISKLSYTYFELRFLRLKSKFQVIKSQSSSLNKRI